jgi:phenazine biosynthesis protein
MTNDIAQFEGLATDVDLRAQNRAVVADYMSRKGETRKSRYLLFTEDGSAGLYTSDTGVPIVSAGHEKLRAHGEWSLRMFPDWEWKNIEIFDTQDPNRFWVECDGEGQILYPGYRPGQYSNHFIHAFLFEDGKIKQQREFMNPFQQLRALDIEVPKINRGGIPT